MLEKKEKIESRCHKKSCKITLEEYNKIVSEDLTYLIRPINIFFKTNNNIKNIEIQLIKELAIDMLIYNMFIFRNIFK